MALRVGISTNVLAQESRIDGIGVYTRALLREFAEREDVRGVPVTMGARAPEGGVALRLAYPLAAALTAATGSSFAGAAALRSSIDVYHATDYRIPRLRGVPVAATVYDAIPLSHPDWASPRLRWVKNAMLRAAVGRADRVVAISHAMVPELIEHYGIARDRIEVIYPGVDADWFARVEPEARAAVLGRFGLEPGYFLAVGTLQPRKNLERALAAHARLPAVLRSARPFVVVGREGWRAEALVRSLREQVGREVRWLERVEDAELRALYQGAAALVFVSLYEGFGLPMVEAFASGTPVIAASGSALAEVAAGAALEVDPTSVDAIASAMTRLDADEPLAAELRERGARRARDFGWDRCAAALAELWQSMSRR